MKQINYKKLILPNIPYVFFVYLFDKVGQAVRLAPGADISAKILNITQGFSAAFENALPSVYPLDLLVGIVGAVIIRLIGFPYQRACQREKREEIPQGRGVRLCPMGKRRRYKALHRPGFPKQHHFDADGTAYHEQPPEAAEVREK